MIIRPTAIRRELPSASRVLTQRLGERVEELIGCKVRFLRTSPVRIEDQGKTWFGSDVYEFEVSGHPWPEVSRCFCWTNSEDELVHVLGGQPPLATARDAVLYVLGGPRAPRDHYG
ncbi:MAG: hypothetical protein HY319_13945 [Armatimonadetes bacterium]|nr:hypothetical protein [Armatimonadota bacterium]